MGSEELNGRVAIITNGRTGIGKATSLALANCGAKVILAGDKKAELTDVKAVIDQMGSEAEIMETDLRIESQCVALVEKTISTFGRLDILVNNAPALWGVQKKVLDLSVDELERGYQLILRAPYIVCREAIPHLMKSDKASIVNIISMGARRCPHEDGLNNSMHLALRAMTVVLSKELRNKAPQIRVFAVYPGGIQGRPDGSDQKSVKPKEISDLIRGLVSYDGHGMIDELSVRPQHTEYYCYP